MRTTLPILLLATALALAAGVCAQAPDAAQVANETVEKGKSTLDGVLGSADAALPGQAPGAGDGGAGLADGPSGLERFLQAVAEGATTAATVTGQALATAGTWMASGLASGVGAGLHAVGAGLSSLGGSLALGLAMLGGMLGSAAAWAGAQLGALLSRYAGFVSTLRPPSMPEPAFVAVAAAGTVGSAGAAGYGLWTLLRKYAWLLSGIAGFSRIEDSALLEHPLRAQVFQVIQQNPGIHASELSRKVGAGWGTIVHHLDKLEKGRLVTARRVNNQKCYFEDGGKVSRQDMAIAGAVRGDSASLITAYVSAHPMTSQKAMAEELGISPALASFHVKKLAALGVLDKVRRGKETLLTTTQAVRRVLPPVALPLPAMAHAQA